MNQELSENVELLSYLIGGNTVVVPHSEKNVMTVIEQGVDHCLIESGLMIPREHLSKFSTISEQLEMTRTDESPVSGSIGIGYEIDEDTWKVLKGIHEGEPYNGDELHIKWLSEAGLVVITESGRVILTEDAKTWISSTQ